jgi:hypothetical protein
MVQSAPSISAMLPAFRGSSPVKAMLPRNASVSPSIPVRMSWSNDL